MKKLLALVLALIMVMALAVSAFAVTILDEDDDDDEDELTVLELIDDTQSKVVTTSNYEDEDFAVLVSTEDAKGNSLKNITAEGTGIVKDVKVSDLDPEKYDTKKAGIQFNVVTKSDKDTVVEGPYNYDKADKQATKLNKAEKTTKYIVVPVEDVKVVEFTIEGNTGVAYADGKLTIKATNKDGDKFSKKYTFVNDVTIFKYEEVKWAAQEEEALVVGDEGYSDYNVAQNGGKYKEAEQDDPSIVAKNSTVVPTTAFRAIKGEKLEVVALKEKKVDVITVTIPEIAEAQKGVNFVAYAEGEWEDKDTDGNKDDVFDADENLTAINFGFYGKQVIASDYTIEYKPGLSYFDFRELFGKKLEEEDIVTFYINKDGKAFDKFTVDYMTVDYEDEVEIVINGKAGTTLGEYSITLKAPANEEEENPNTGAESVVAVVAAMAVVSAVAAAAVTLKK